MLESIKCNYNYLNFQIIESAQSSCFSLTNLVLWTFSQIDSDIRSKHSVNKRIELDIII